MGRRIVVSADHGGYELKEKIKKMLGKARYSVEDVGTHSAESCDYPRYGYMAAKKVSRKKADRGIVVCKTGIGMAVIANKVRGVRAGTCYDRADAISSRQHNDTNVLVLAANKVSEKKALEIVKVWLKTKALKGRHTRRVRQITKLEKSEFKR
jgi:RpiB/LacA/LacB family sugar-phosphate isomerase